MCNHSFKMLWIGVGGNQVAVCVLCEFVFMRDTINDEWKLVAT